MNCVWFKRDCRIADHQPLVNALKAGQTVCLYVIEPELLSSAEWDSRHSVFVLQGVRQLRERLRERGGELYIRVGNFPDVLAAFYEEIGSFSALYSYEETGNKLTYDRDIRVKAWCDANNIKWYETPQGGVVRRLDSRDNWTKHWRQRMHTPPLPAPESVSSPIHGLAAGDMPTLELLGLTPLLNADYQLGGETIAQATLTSFLNKRGQPYQKAMSSPVSAWEGCSRLSPYLAWGHISIKQVVHATWQRIHELKDLKKSVVDKAELVEINSWLRSMRSFEKRLHWRDHFMQKLEDQPDIEFNNFNRGFDGLREDDWNDYYFHAWCQGQTGYPLVDACMRCLHQTGWINFRMRAMLVSFASYQLWLHWRPTSVYLASQFLDFEPGIHFSQFQMQSGTTGINTIRMYSPIKQAKDQDPTGQFIRQWVPELANVPDEFIAEPHTMPPLLQSMAGFIIGQDYPEPIVDHGAAYKRAQKRIYAAKSQPSVQAASDKVYRRHGSRKRPRD